MKPIIPEKGKQSHTHQSYVPEQQTIYCSKTKRQSKICKSKIISRMQTASLKIKISGVKSCVLIRMCTFLSFLDEKINIIQNSIKCKVAFLLCLTKFIILTLWFINGDQKSALKIKQDKVSLQPMMCCFTHDTKVCS